MDTVQSPCKQPNLSGLWSCAVLGQPKWWSKPVGGCVLSCLVGSWIGGFALPVVVPLLAVIGYHKSATLLGAIATYPYVVNVKPWPLAARFWLLAAHWFGGASMSYEERDPNDNSVPTMQCYFPHGIFTLGIILNSGIRTAATWPDGKDWASYVGTTGPCPYIGLAAESLLRAPLFGHFVARWTGVIGSAAKSSFISRMRKGESFGLLPGGFHEASLTEYGKDRVVVGNKKGFIKYALQYGYKVVPAYTFGECYTYWNLPGFHRLRAWLADRGLPGIIIFGFPLFPCLPLQTPWGIHTIHGSGIKFPKIEEPTKADVDKYHAIFVADLQALFDRHKWRFGLAGVQLEIM
eukprot:TRINITY_DN68078_c0_g1_i1.p1 TRINITY_DN68078_c0_g1~~TRINITY_DN68078_c0_g1_i1.p1  ORF type:complete len:349 (+),score=31.99 TRINITY_DN68078_c0_g1_i1:46-1092(+)